jgi:hypothetical protein
VEIIGNTGSTAAIPFLTGTATDPSLNVIGTRTAADVLTVTGAAGQTGNLQEWRNSAGTALVSIGSNGSVRIGNGRVTINKSVAPPTGLNVNYTASVTEILDAGIIGFSASAVRTLTFPSASGAAGLVQALPGTPAIGDVFTFYVYNTTANNVNLVGGAGVNIVNGTPITNTLSRPIYCRVTSVAAGAETISVY